MSPPDITFRGQPREPGDFGGEVLRRLLSDQGLDKFTVVVAWAKYRGLARLRQELTEFRDRGTSRIVLGIDEGGATRPGLLGALSFFTEAFVYHERGAGTFHPKIYLAEGSGRAVLVVGSSNATAGGLFLNHEASLEADFALPADESHSALVESRNYIARLIDDGQVCRPLTEQLIDELVADDRLRVSGHEKFRPRKAVSLPPGTEEEDLDVGGSDAEEQPKLFGTSRYTRIGVPNLSDAAKEELSRFEVDREEPPADVAPSGIPAAPPPAPPPPAPSPSPTPPPTTPVIPPALAQLTVVSSWDKKLPAGDAQQQPNPKTNPTYNLRLTQAEHDVDQRVYFRKVLFSGVPWAKTFNAKGQEIENVSVPMDVIVKGQSLGMMVFHLSHAKHRESGQGNHTTVLHWGPLMSVLRATNYTDDIVSLARLTDGSYRLEIS